jgi:DNA-3-methyladenine glycosylase I
MKMFARIWLITTNDNIDALRFYQKRGYEMKTVHRYAMEVSRKTKPQIPFEGKYGIPIRDEIEMEKLF